MPERYRLSDEDDDPARVCALADEWGVDPLLMGRVIRAARYYKGGRPVTIISGYRTRKEQDDLRRSGRPAAADHLSTHRTCPATGLDISLGALPTRKQIAFWGEAATVQGLRWGGGSRVDPETGMPSDWGHVDLGPRGS